MAEIEPIIPEGELFVGIDKLPCGCLIIGLIVGAGLLWTGYLLNNNFIKISIALHPIHKLINP